MGTLVVVFIPSNYSQGTSRPGLDRYSTPYFSFMAKSESHSKSSLNLEKLFLK